MFETASVTKKNDWRFLGKMPSQQLRKTHIKLSFLVWKRINNNN